MFKKISLLLILLLTFISLIGCEKENTNVIGDNVNINEKQNRFEKEDVFQVNDDIIVKFPNYSIDSNTGIVTAKSDDIEINLYYFIGIDKIFGDEEISTLLDNQVTSMDDVNAIKFGYVVESLIYQMMFDYNIDIGQYEKEWINNEYYNCFHLFNIRDIDNHYCDILIFYDEYNNGVIAFLLKYQEGNEYLVEDFIETFEFKKEYKMSTHYKDELDMIYPTVIRQEIEILVD